MAALLGAALLAGWAAWFVMADVADVADVALYEITGEARLEVASAVFRETPRWSVPSELLISGGDSETKRKSG